MYINFLVIIDAKLRKLRKLNTCTSFFNTFAEKNMSKKGLTYENAMAEIEMIVEGIENNQFSIDELSEKVKRISELVLFCKEKLRQTEEQVNKIINEIKE